MIQCRQRISLQNIDDNWTSLRHQVLQLKLSLSSLENTDMRLTLSSLVLSSAAFCATAAFAANQARVDVPFSFTAKGHSYPAGMYDVELEGDGSFVTLASRVDLEKQIRWNVGPAEPAFKAAVVTFDQTGTDHELKTIQ